MSNEGKPLQEAFTRFYCDHCHQPIEDINKGYVVWRTGAEGYRDFMVIHQKVCDQDKKTYSASGALKDFLGLRGQAKLGSLLSAGSIRVLFGDTNHSKVQPQHMDSFIDFWRRMQLPHYEEARRRFNNVQLLNDYSDAGETLPYLHLEKIIQKYPDPDEDE